MRVCKVCGASINPAYICSSCGEAYCSEHRLPEIHGCRGLPSRGEMFWPSRSRNPQGGRFGWWGYGAGRGGGRLRGTEIQHILIAWLVLGLAFSVGTLFRVPAQFPQLFAITLVTVGSGFILHELAHKFTAQRFGWWAEFRLWVWGLFMALLFAFMSGGLFIFAAPGAVYIFPRGGYYDEGYGYGNGRREYGIISLAGPLTNVLVALVFLSLSGLGGILSLLGSMGFRVNVFLAAFNMLPFGMLDGYKVFRWNPLLWAAVSVPLWILVFFPSLFGRILF